MALSSKSCHLTSVNSSRHVAKSAPFQLVRPSRTVVSRSPHSIQDTVCSSRMAGLAHVGRPIGHAVDSVWNPVEQWIEEGGLGGWSPANIPDMTGKTALVTGASSGIGYAVTRKLAEKGCKVYMVSRDLQKGIDAANTIRAGANGKPIDLEVLKCDLGQMQDIVDMCNEFKRKSKKLDLLISIAGTMYPAPAKPLAKSQQGIEATLAINFHAAAILTLSLLDIVKATPGARIVYESSALEILGKLDWENMRGEKYSSSGLFPYATSKMMLTMWTMELARRVPEVDIFCVHPGFVRGELYEKASTSFFIGQFIRAASYLVGSRPAKGAWSALYAATEPSIARKGFQFFGPSFVAFNQYPTYERPFFRSGRFADRENAAKLWSATQSIINKELGPNAPPSVEARA